MLLPDLPGGIQTFGRPGRRHPDVHHDQVGRSLGDQRQQLRPVAGLADHLHA